MCTNKDYSCRFAFKTCVTYFNILAIVTGVLQILMGIAGIWFSLKDDEHYVVNALDIPGFDFYGVICGSALCAIGIFGIVTASCIDSHAWKIVYTIIIGVLIVFTAGMLIGTLVTREKIMTILYSEESCLDHPGLKSADDKVQTAAATFCSAKCPCNNFYATDSKKGSAISMLTCKLCEADDPEVQAFVAKMGGEPYCQKTANGSAKDFQQEYFGDQWLEHVGIMTWMEEELDCAGVCQPVDYYLFSDVNAGLPETSCRTRFSQYADERLVLYAGIQAMCISWMCMVFVISICIYCQPKDARRNVGNVDLHVPLVKYKD